MTNKILFPLTLSLCLSSTAMALTETEARLNAVAKQLSNELSTLKDKYQLPSLVIAVDYKGKTLVNQASGYADIAQQRKADLQTTYSVGSIAKPMTTLAMARLMEQNKLTLNTPVSAYASYPQIWQNLTPLQLASHTAGIVHYNNSRHDREFRHPRDHWKPAEALDVFSHEAMQFSPGENFKYSSSGYILLSDVIAKAAKTNYLELMHNEVFKPLAMNNTLFDSSLANKGVEATYYETKQAGEKRQLATTKRDRSFLFGGGAYQSTAKNLVAMAWGMQNDEYLTSSTRELLFTPVTLKSGNVNPQNYGLGFRIHDMDVSQYIPGKPKQLIKGVHHGGTTSNAANAYVLTFPKYGLSIAYTTNSIPVSLNKQDNLQVEMWIWLYRFVEALQQQ